MKTKISNLVLLSLEGGGHVEKITFFEALKNIPPKKVATKLEGGG